MPKHFPMQGTDFPHGRDIGSRLKIYSTFVTIGDINSEACHKAAEELGKYAKWYPSILNDCVADCHPTATCRHSNVI